MILSAFPAFALSAALVSAMPSAALSQTEAASTGVATTEADTPAAEMQDKGIDAGPAAAIATRDILVPGPAGEIMARVFTPAGAGPFPVIV